MQILVLVLFLYYIPKSFSSEQISAELSGQHLLHYLFSNNRYDSRVRPADNANGTLRVTLGLKLTQILNIDEKNQIMSTSVWIRQEWSDLRLIWDPREFNGIKQLKIPSETIWRPDIVLYNNADGEFAITHFTKVTVSHNGKVVWEPPALYKSYCQINVEFFPFDTQECFMKFSIWTYDGSRVDLHHVCSTAGIPQNTSSWYMDGIDLRGFFYNVQWDIINVTARRNVKIYACCPEWYPDITFFVTIRRRTLFYIVNLIIPCIAISCLTILVFYLPADSGEKITLSLSILMALAVFFLLLNDIIPPTSLVMPMIGKYLLFTMIIVVISIILTVIIISINFRSPSTHEMSSWVRRLFIEMLPRVLFMDRPKPMKNKPPVSGDTSLDSSCSSSARNSQEFGLNQIANCSRRNGQSVQASELMNAAKEIRHIADSLEDEENSTAEIQDWKFISKVIDRLFLYIYSITVLTGSIGIFLHAPSLYDNRIPLVNERGSNTSCIY